MEHGKYIYLLQDEYIYIYLYTYIFIYISLYIYIYIFVYIYSILLYNSQVADETRFDRAMNAGRILLVAKSSFWMLKFACLVVGKSSIHPSSPPLYAHYIYIYWLVVFLPLWKIWKSVGMMTFPISGRIKAMFQTFQTTNQYIYIYVRYKSQ